MSAEGIPDSKVGWLFMQARRSGAVVIKGKSFDKVAMQNYLLARVPTFEYRSPLRFSSVVITVRKLNMI